MEEEEKEERLESEACSQSSSDITGFLSWDSVSPSVECGVVDSLAAAAPFGFDSPRSVECLGRAEAGRRTYESTLV